VKTLWFVLIVFVLSVQRQYALPEPLMMALAGSGLMGIAALVRRSLQARPASVQALQPRELLAEASRQLAGRASRARRRPMHA